MKKHLNLTKQERKIEKSLDSKKWVEAPKALKEEIVKAAKHNMTSRKREARVNIRLMQGTVDLIRHKAEQEGLGYQTLMSSVLHKYATGRFVDREVIDKVAVEIASKAHSRSHGKRNGE